MVGQGVGLGAPCQQQHPRLGAAGLAGPSLEASPVAGPEGAGLEAGRDAGWEASLEASLEAGPEGAGQGAGREAAGREASLEARPFHQGGLEAEVEGQELHLEMPREVEGRVAAAEAAPWAQTVLGTGAGQSAREQRKQLRRLVGSVLWGPLLRPQLPRPRLRPWQQQQLFGQPPPPFATQPLRPRVAPFESEECAAGPLFLPRSALASSRFFPLLQERQDALLQPEVRPNHPRFLSACGPLPAPFCYEAGPFAAEMEKDEGHKYCHMRRGSCLGFIYTLQKRGPTCCFRKMSAGF